MKHITWALALTVSLAWAGEARAQFVPPYYYYPYYSSGYGYGQSGVGFAYLGRRFSVYGFFGGLSGAVSRNYALDVYAPAVVVPAPPIVLRPVPVFAQGEPRRGRDRRPTLEEEIAGIDLDLVEPKKPAPRPSVPDTPAPDPAVRPKEIPPPKEVTPPKPKEPPPETGPKAESARLVKLGQAFFSAEAFGVAAHRFRQATLADPKGARAHFLLAQTWFALGKYRDAVDSIHAGMKLHKNWPKAPFQPRIDLYAGIETSLDEQLERLRAAVKAAPDQPALKFLLGYQLWFDDRPGSREEAVVLFRQARVLAPDRTFIDQFLAAAGPGPVAAK
jgi:hypothetical protein